ncbi:MAG: polyphosphate kinase 1 [Acidimicrobiales bacterium]|nr:polyphosphate kinase 1 [Acidimicrobiales bacterium]
MDDDFPYINRELSWLDFNDRVLAIADDETVPLLERAKFLAIHSSNLDEFFQVRVAGVVNQLAAGVGKLAPDAMNRSQILAGIREKVQQQHERAERIFHTELVPALATEGIAYSNWQSLDDDDREFLDVMFRDRMFPVLTPLAVDPAHPFPYISNKSLNLAVFLRHPEGGALQFARVKVPPILPRFVVMPDGERFVPLEQVIAVHLGELFPGMDVVSHVPFRVTRDTDIEIDDDTAADLMEEIESQLARRRFGGAVRLEVEQHVEDEALELLQRELRIDPQHIYLLDGPLDMTGLWSLYNLDRPELKYETYTPQIPPAFLRARAAGRSIWATLRDQDVLVHHPYESFVSSVEEFVARAAKDPWTLAIKMTLYRTASDSTIVDSLIEAAQAGKQVVVLVELKARFDEEANIGFARRLERAGVHVAYGLVGLKTHSKTALVVRQEGDTIRRYGHIGTGNYNAQTARIYEDLGVFTSDPEVGADLTYLFNSLTGYSADDKFNRLVIAPQSVRPAILELIDIESHYDDGHIVMKMNSLVDPEIIQALYEASRRGTRVDLIVRGICCLVPDIEGVSENINVVSIVGRYLEHSRIYRFGSAARGYHHLIGSADMMQRNLDGRVECLAPVSSPNDVDRLNRMIDLYLDEDAIAWHLDNEGVWSLHRDEHSFDVQEAMEQGAAAAYLYGRQETI